MEGKKKNLLQNIAVLLLTFLIFLFILELGLRFFYFYTGKNKKGGTGSVDQEDLRPRFIYENNEKAGYSLKPNLNTNFRNIKTTKLITNSNGLRDREFEKKGEGVFRIVVLGDSFTFGWDVEADMSYPKQLERMLNDKITGKRFEVVNCGVPGYGTDQELKFFENISVFYEPDLVLIGFYIGNDITDNMIGGIKRRSVKDGYLLDNYLHEKIDYENIYLKIAKKYFTQRSRLFSFLSDRYEKFILKLGYHADVNPYYQLEIKQLDVFRKSYDAETKMGIEKTEKLIEKIDLVASEKGAGVAVVLIPAFYQVYPKAWENYLSSYGLVQSLYDQNRPNEVLNDFFKEHGIKTVDLTESFKRIGEKKNLYLFGHWNERGHSIATDIIFDFIKKNYFVD